MQLFITSQILQIITMPFFYKKLPRKNLLQNLVTFWGQKKHCKNGITVVVICKLFEIIKRYIIILSIDCNTYSHTLSKKQKSYVTLKLVNSKFVKNMVAALWNESSHKENLYLTCVRKKELFYALVFLK